MLKETRKNRKKYLVFSFICGSKKKVGLIEVENRVVIRRS
jgi:hypothetical protein